MNKKPSVTELVNLLDKPALLNWANKIGLDGLSLSDYRKQSTKSGTSIHKQIENDFKGKMPFENEKFIAFKSKYEVVQVEPCIECEHYLGRADILLKRADENYLFDFKNSDKVYFEQVIQLVAYDRVLKPEKIGIVNTNTFEEIFIDLTEFQKKQYTNILSALVLIYNSKQKLFHPNL